MPQIMNADGSAPKTEPRGLKLRLCDVYRKPGQTALDIMNEIKVLTDKDLADFKQWFIDAGLPVT